MYLFSFLKYLQFIASVDLHPFLRNLQNIGEQLFPTEKVLKTFPNLRVKNNGKEIFIRDLIENK